jgi:hypothetical protein
MNGQDADMIMLALATHEPFFYVIREVQRFSNNSSSSSSKRGGAKANTKAPKVATTVFQFFRVNILRECLINELTEDLSEELNHMHTEEGAQEEPGYDSERLIDDFVFLTFLVGNDFLPNIPSLSIGEGAFDIMFTAYKDLLHHAIGYITKDGLIQDVDRLQELFTLISLNEPTFMRDQIKAIQLKKASNAIDNDEMDDEVDPWEQDDETLARAVASINKLDVLDYRQHYYQKKLSIEFPDAIHELDDQAYEALPDLRQVRLSYVSGLVWCLAYYSRGCVNWKWFYPYHYAPLLRDLTYSLPSIVEEANKLVYGRLGEPFSPYQQLLACLPPSSAELLPSCYQQLMRSPSSPIHEYFPTTLVLDMDGKARDWEAVVVLPFIDEDRLITIESQYCSEDRLSSDELHRNRFGNPLLYRQVEGGILCEELARDIRPMDKAFTSMIQVGTDFDSSSYPSLRHIYSSRAAAPKYFPNNCSIRLRFNSNDELLLMALAMNVQAAYPSFTPLFNAPKGTVHSVPGAGKPFSITLCSSLNSISNSITIVDVMEGLLPSLAFIFSPPTLRLTGQVIRKKNKAYLTLIVEDISHVRAMGEYLCQNLPGCNSWYVDQPGRLSLVLGTYQRSSSSPAIDENGNSVDDVMKVELERIVMAEIRKLSESGYLDLCCEEIEVSEELFNYPRTPIRLKPST